MEWNERNDVLDMEAETNRLVIGKRVAAEMMVLCLAVMSLGGEPLQSCGMTIQKMKFMDCVRTIENLKSKANVRRIAGDKTLAEIVKAEGIAEIAETEAWTETGNYVSLPEAAAGETIYLKKAVTEIPSVAWNPAKEISIISDENQVEETSTTANAERVKEISTTVDAEWVKETLSTADGERVKETSITADEKQVKETSADHLSGSENEAKRETTALPVDRTEFTVNEDIRKDATTTLDDKADTITPVTPSEVPAADTDTIVENPDGMNPGFLMDEPGKITGIRDKDLAVVDGCLILPPEGCTGIAAGAFLGTGDGIIEVYLPANMTDLEEGAFLGLNEAEWIDTAEENPVYSCEDGVLFSKDGSCLFAFPAGRTGTYLLPESVTRIAADAFAGASIEKISNLRDREIDFGNIPENIVLE